jgi:hypothetical protein
VVGVVRPSWILVSVHIHAPFCSFGFLFFMVPGRHDGVFFWRFSSLYPINLSFYELHLDVSCFPLSPPSKLLLFGFWCEFIWHFIFQFSLLLLQQLFFKDIRVYLGAADVWHCFFWFSVIVSSLPLSSPRVPSPSSLDLMQCFLPPAPSDLFLCFLVVRSVGIFLVSYRSFAPSTTSSLQRSHVHWVRRMCPS